MGVPVLDTNLSIREGNTGPNILRHLAITSPPTILLVQFCTGNYKLKDLLEPEFS